MLEGDAEPGKISVVEASGQWNGWRTIAIVLYRTSHDSPAFWRR